MSGHPRWRPAIRLVSRRARKQLVAALAERFGSMTAYPPSTASTIRLPPNVASGRDVLWLVDNASVRDSLLSISARTRTA